jgi:hypothetical protein
MVEITLIIPEFTLPDRTVSLRGILSALDEIQSIVCRWDEIHKWDKDMGIQADPRLDAEIQFYHQILAYHQTHPLLPLPNTNHSATMYAIQDAQICGYIHFADSGRLHFNQINILNVNLCGSSHVIRQTLFDGMLHYLSNNLVKFFVHPLTQLFTCPMPDVWELQVFSCRIGQSPPKDWQILMQQRDSNRHYVNLDFSYINQARSNERNAIPIVFP